MISASAATGDDLVLARLDGAVLTNVVIPLAFSRASTSAGVSSVACWAPAPTVAGAAAVMALSRSMAISNALGEHVGFPLPRRCPTEPTASEMDSQLFIARPRPRHDAARAFLDAAIALLVEVGVDGRWDIACGRTVRKAISPDAAARRRRRRHSARTPAVRAAAKFDASRMSSGNSNWPTWPATSNCATTGDPDRLGQSAYTLAEHRQHGAHGRGRT